MTFNNAKITALRASDVQMGRHLYHADWDGLVSAPGTASGMGVLTIHGVATLEQLDEIMRLVMPKVTPLPANEPEKTATVTPIKAEAPAAAPTPTAPAPSVLNEFDEAPTPIAAKAAPKAAPGLVEDLSAFGRMNLLGEIVAEIQIRGAKNYLEVCAFIAKLRDMEVCPALDKLEKEGKLTERVKRQCAAKGLEGAL